MLNLEPVEFIDIDVGQGDYYIGTPYTIPYFFENRQIKMMHEPDKGDSISFRSWRGNYYQFFLDVFHHNVCLYITSTLLDCYPMSRGYLSLERSVENYRKASQKKHPIKGAYTGYYTFGKKLVEQHDALVAHLEADKMYFTDEVLEMIYRELKRRAKQ